MLNYTLKIWDNLKRSEYYIDFEDDDFQLLGYFLNHLRNDDFKRFKDSFDSVLSGEERYIETGRGPFDVEIGLMVTKIFSDYWEYGVCIIDTWKVRYLLDIWSEERLRTKESRQQAHDKNAGQFHIPLRSQEEINRAYSLLEDDALNAAAEEDARIYLKVLGQAAPHSDRVHRMFDSAKQAAAAKGGKLTEADIRYLHRVYFVNKEKDIPQTVINEYILKAFRGYDFSDLKNTEQHFDQDTLEYLFEGRLDDTARAIGYHYQSSRDTTGSIIPGQEIRTGKFGVYHAEVQVAGIQKSEGSSFFPDNMSRQDVIDAINEAYANRMPYPDRDGYLGVSDGGMKIMMYLKENGKIEAVYPLYEEGRYVELW